MRHATKLGLAFVVLLLLAFGFAQTVTITPGGSAKKMVLKGPMRIEIIPEGSAPPPVGPEITTASPVQSGTEGVFYTINFGASGGVLPYVWSVGPTGAAITGWTAANNDPAFVETVGDPSPCALDNAWPDASGVTTDATGKLTGDCSVKKIVSTASVVRNGFSRSALWVQYEIRPETWPSSLQLTGLGMLDATSAVNHCAPRVDQTGAYSLSSSGGSTVALFTGTLDGWYRIDTFAETTGIAAGSKCHAIAFECTSFTGTTCNTWTDVSGGVKESSDGTWTEPIARLRIPAGDDTLWLDSIKQCDVGWNYLDACDGTATNLWSATVAACPDDLYIDDVRVSVSLWNCSGTTLTLTHGVDPDTVTVEGGYLDIPGLTLSAAGVLSGTPTTADTYGFDVRVCDDNALCDTETFSLVAAAPGEPEDPEPYEREFTAVRTHCVGTAATGDGLGGDCDNRETLDNAIAHVTAGDDHQLKAGTYTGAKTISNDCTAANPCRWGAVIDVNGDPEQALIAQSWEFTGDWHWVWPMYQIHPTTESFGDATIQMEARGVSVINSVFQRRRQAGCIDSFAYGADMVIYGNTAIDCGWNQQQTPSRHNMYTQNRDAIHGTKYVVGNTFLDVAINPPSGNNRGTIHHGASGTSQETFSRLSGYWWENNTHQGGSTFMTTYAPRLDQSAPVQDFQIRNTWMFGPAGRLQGTQTVNSGDGLLYGNHQNQAIDIQDSLFVDYKVRFVRVWGADTSGCWTQNHPNIFKNNSIYDPINRYLEITNVGAYTSGDPCGGTTTALFRNADDWDNNTYGKSSGTGTFGLNCGGTDHGTANTFAQWKTRTGDCRASGTDFDLSSTEGAAPTVDEHECFSNFYNPNWGKCRAVDWDGNGSITLPAAEVAKIIGNGKTYKVRDERNYFGTPLTSGTWATGTNITFSKPGTAVGDLVLVWITSQP